MWWPERLKMGSRRWKDQEPESGYCLFWILPCRKKTDWIRFQRRRQEGYRYIAMLTCHEDFRLIQKAMRIGDG